MANFAGAALVLVLVAAASAQTMSRLAGHSLGSPPNIYRLSMDWTLAGTVIPSGQSLVLQPGVPGRSGSGWARTPLLTDNFEAQFVFSAKSPEKRTASNNGFAFWYVNENATDAQDKIVNEHMHNQEEIISNSWETAFDVEKFGLFAYRNQFDGLGIFFCDDAQGAPVVSALLGNGNMPYKLGMTVPDSDAMKYDWRSGKEVLVRVRVEPTNVKVSIEGGPSKEFKTEMKKGYLGFSAHGGKKGSMDAKEMSEFIQVVKMDVNNFASSGAAGETEVKAVDETPVKSDEDVLAKTSSFRDHRAESDAIKDLTNMVFKLVAESQPVRSQISNGIQSLANRVDKMEATFEALKAELDKKTGHKLAEEFQQIKDVLGDLGSTAKTEMDDRSKLLDTLHQDMSDVHASSDNSDLNAHIDKLSEANTRALDNLTNENQKMFGFSMSAIAFIIIAGLALYNKFWCWEKKNVL